MVFRLLVKDLERERPQAILDLIESGDQISATDAVRMPTEQKCARCGFMSSQRLCKACLLLHGLETDNTQVGVSKKGKLSAQELESLASERVQRLAIDENTSGGGCGTGECACSVDF